MIKLKTFFGVICLLYPGTSFAATDGTLGTSSTGVIGVSVELTPEPALISITGLQDVNFDKTVGGSLKADQTITACVYMDDVGTYGVEVEATPLTSEGQSYAYNLSIDQNVTGSTPLNLSVTNATVEASATGFLPSDIVGCNGDARLVITFKDVANAAITDPFSATATVTLIVMPD